jgi:endonuclease YncB( thermonuclease family)
MGKKFLFLKPLVLGLFGIFGIFPSSIYGQADLVLIGEEITNVEVKNILNSGLLILEIEGQETSFHLANIQMPDSTCDIGSEALKFLRKKVQGKIVEAHIVGYLKGGEMATGHVVAQGADPRFDLVEQGLARYCPGSLEEKGLEELEREAQKEKRGIWGLSKKEDIPECEIAA